VVVALLVGRVVEPSERRRLRVGGPVPAVENSDGHVCHLLFVDLIAVVSKI
jgi:hypothetical protein